ncbi:MAG: hypothetical protein GX318_03535, partial [Clostridia bacterium]|nr:hypothetical protein [Clostridia bacterium]
MRKRFSCTFLLAFILVLMFSLPAFGNEILLSINGEEMDAKGVLDASGVTMVPVEAFHMVPGVTAEYIPGGELKISGNGSLFSLKIGDNKAILNDSPVSLPVDVL